MTFTNLTTFLHEDTGATSVEYGLIASLITLVCLASLTAVGAGLGHTFVQMRDAISA